MVCRVFHKNSGIRRNAAGVELSRIDSFVDHLLAESPAELPPLTDYNSSVNERPSSSFGGAHQATRVFLDDHKVQMQYDQRNLFLPPQNYPINTTSPFLAPQIALPTSFPHHQASSPYLAYHHQQQQDGLMSSMYHHQQIQTSALAAFQGANLRLPAPKMEHFSSNNSVMSHSEDTGVSTDHEITSKKAAAAFDDDQGLGFSPNISDLDSLWSY